MGPRSGENVLQLLVRAERDVLDCHSTAAKDMSVQKKIPLPARSPMQTNQRR